MRPAVVIAVLLSAVYVLDTVAARRERRSTCAEFSDDACEDGWWRFDEDRCVQFVDTAETFSDAEAHCQSLGSELVELAAANPLQNEEETTLLCVAISSGAQEDDMWIKVAGQDSSTCRELSIDDQAVQTVVPCSDKMPFACIKDIL